MKRLCELHVIDPARSIYKLSKGMEMVFDSGVYLDPSHYLIDQIDERIQFKHAPAGTVTALVTEAHPARSSAQSKFVYGESIMRELSLR